MEDKPPIWERMGEGWAVRNEFAMVHVRVDNAGHDPVLVIQDMHSGSAIFLDALELEALTRVTHQDLAPFLDPSGPLDEPEDE